MTVKKKRESERTGVTLTPWYQSRVKRSASLRIFSTFVSYMRCVNIAVICYVVASVGVFIPWGPSNEKR